jgi:hypothetical protein
MAGRATTREDDEILLRAMDLRETGWSFARIVKKLRLPTGAYALDRAIQRVERDYRESLYGPMREDHNRGARLAPRVSDMTGVPDQTE